MITRDQAMQIADALIAQEREEQAQMRDSRARRVPWVYRSAALETLRPLHQAELVRMAKQAVRREWLTQLAAMGLLAAVVFTWKFGPGAYASTTASVLVVVGAILGQQFLFTLRTRSVIATVLAVRRSAKP